MSRMAQHDLQAPGGVRDVDVSNGVRSKGTCLALYSERFSNPFRGSARTALGRVYQADDKERSKDLQNALFCEWSVPGSNR
jgi:hypothetical protein